MRIHQLLSGAGPVDAVTGQAGAYRRLFEEWGAGGGVYAAASEPGTPGVEPLRKLDAAPDDLLLFHYSAWAPQLEPLLELPPRKALVYHNVTPADLLWRDQPHLALQCQMGRDRLPLWVKAVDVVCAVSGFNARELVEAGADEVHVVPILYEPIARAAAVPPSPPRVLSVGRLAPHKRPDLVLRAFALYRELAPEASLLMIGAPLSRTYLESLREAAPPGVSFTGAVSAKELHDAYASSSVLLSQSAHEGFWVPLLEAFDFQLPVVAPPVGGMPEVGGDAVLWADDDDLAVVAQLIDLAVSDGDLRAELARRGRARLEEFAHERTAAKLRAALGV
jgi:glycosyltransferase involved in cell wall biosynthesis